MRTLRDSGTWAALRRGLWFCSRIRCLSPYRNAGLSIQRAKLIDANAFGGGRDYQFHPDGIRTLEYEVSVALRRASMLSCCFPEVAVAKPGSSNTTHESLAISLKLIETSGLSVFTRISVPARTVVALSFIVKSLPLWLSTIGDWAAAPPGAAPPRPPGAPPLAAPGPPGPPGAPPFAAPG